MAAAVVRAVHSSPRAPLSLISAKVIFCALARVAIVDMKTRAALRGIRVVASIPRIGLYGPAVTQESLVTVRLLR